MVYNSLFFNDMFCSNCGSENSNSAKFCKQCGNQNGSVQSASSSVQNSHEQVGNKQKKMIFQVAGSILCIAGFIKLRYIGAYPNESIFYWVILVVGIILISVGSKLEVEE